MFLFYLLSFFLKKTQKGDTIQVGILCKGWHYLWKYGRFALKSSKALLLFLFSQFVLKHALTLYFSSKFKANLFHIFYSSNEIERHIISIWSLFVKILISLYTLGDFRNIATNHIHILICSSNLQFLQYWYQNAVNILFLLVKPLKVTSGFIFKNHDKNC